MPNVQLLPLASPSDEPFALGFSRAELREISEALRGQIPSLLQLDAAAYGEPIARSLSALAKTLQYIGQKPGEKCFLCRSPLVAGPDVGQVHCAKGCDSPSAYLSKVARGV
jgi:hypothetical protein